MKEEEYKYLKELLGKINHEDVSTNERVYDPNIFKRFSWLKRHSCKSYVIRRTTGNIV